MKRNLWASMAKLFFKDKPIIGLDISQTGVKVMAIDPKKMLVLGYGSVELDPMKMQKMLDGSSTAYLTESITELIEKRLVGTIASNHVVIGIPTSRSYSQTFSLPTKAKKSLRDAVELEVEQYIPVPIESLYVDYEIVEQSKEHVTAVLAAAPKTLIDACIEAATAAGLRPVLVEPSINAVTRVLKITEEGDLPSLVIDIGATSTDIAVLDHGAVRVSGAANVGGNNFTVDIAKKLGVALENAHQLKVLSGLSAGPRQQKITGALEPSLQIIVGEIKKVLRYYNERVENGRKIEQVLIVGGGSNIPGIGDYFTNALVMAARVAVPWQRLNFGKLEQPGKQFKARYITVAGLASISPTEVVT